MLLTDWKADVGTPTYWGVIAVIVVAYTGWYRLTDKRRLADLLLFGSLLAVMRMITDVAGVSSGFWYYKVRILPMAPSIFLYNLTIIPLTFMLVQQYSSNWKQFFVWTGAACTFVCFGILQTLVRIDLLVLMHWNYVYAFIVMYIEAIVARGAFHLVIQVQEKACDGQTSPLQSTLIHPAFKPMQDEEGDTGPRKKE